MEKYINNQQKFVFDCVLLFAAAVMQNSFIMLKNISIKLKMHQIYMYLQTLTKLY